MKTMLNKIQGETSRKPVSSSCGYFTDKHEKYSEMLQLRSGSVVGGPEFKTALKGLSKSENLSRIGSLIEKANQRDIGV